MDTRNKIRDIVAAVPGLAYWQSEYCILGDNAGEIDGGKKDTGMTAALYIAKVVSTDLTAANAAAWQWWIAISGYDYKDGLIYVDKNNTNGNYHDSKMMWALGNFSRFVRPGMKRIQASIADLKDVYVSGFAGNPNKELVFVLVNAGNAEQLISLKDISRLHQYKKAVYYKTDSSESLGKHALAGDLLNLPAQSVLTIVLK